jgi:hypothetical protein
VLCLLVVVCAKNVHIKISPSTVEHFLNLTKVQTTTEANTVDSLKDGSIRLSNGTALNETSVKQLIDDSRTVVIIVNNSTASDSKKSKKEQQKQRQKPFLKLVNGMPHSFFDFLRFW